MHACVCLCVFNPRLLNVCALCVFVCVSICVLAHAIKSIYYSHLEMNHYSYLMWKLLLIAYVGAWMSVALHSVNAFLAVFYLMYAVIHLQSMSAIK